MLQSYSNSLRSIKIFRKFLCLNVFLLLIVISSCETKTPFVSTVIQGEIHMDEQEAQIYYLGYRKSISLTKDHTFRDTITIDQPQYIYLSVGENSTRAYITPGDTVTISIDSIFSFSDSNANINTYLYQLHISDDMLAEKEFKFHKKTFSQKETDYVRYRDSIKENRLIHLAELPSGTEAFKDFHRKDIEYQYKYDVARYPNYHSYYFNDYKPTDIINNFYNGVSIDNETYAQNYSGFRSLVDIILDKRVENLKDSKLNPLEASLRVLKDIKSPSILHLRLNKALFHFTVNEKNMKNMLNEMLALAKLDKTKQAIIEHYNIISELKPGTPAPNFNFENFAGGKIQLTDLEGKYVYIDVWATWCSPCIREIPYLKKIQKEFQGSNIEFVSISLDDERFYSTWRKMIKNKELGGIHLIADNGMDSDFYKDYGLQGLPHFILLDSQGKIVSAKAENPSNYSELREQLIKLGL